MTEPGGDREGRATLAEMIRELGVSRQHMHVIERRALAKMRALIGGTEDYPLLRAVLLERGDLAAAIERDAVTSDRHLVIHREQSRRSRRVRT